MGRPHFLKLQKRLAQEVLKCGRRKAWLDPTAREEISKVTTREGIRELVAQGLIRYDPVHPWRPAKKVTPAHIAHRHMVRSRVANEKKQKYENKAKKLEEQRRLVNRGRMLYKEIYETS